MITPIDAFAPKPRVCMFIYMVHIFTHTYTCMYNVCTLYIYVWKTLLDGEDAFTSLSVYKQRYICLCLRIGRRLYEDVVKEVSKHTHVQISSRMKDAPTNIFSHSVGTVDWSRMYTCEWRSRKANINNGIERSWGRKY